MQWNDIHGRNDAVLLDKILRGQGFYVTILTDSRATANNIRRQLAEQVDGAMPGDIVYIHFSSHGQPVEDISGDETDGWDESVVAYDAAHRYKAGVYTGENHITDDELGKYISEIRRRVGRKGFVYVVVDACHAGDFSRGEDTVDDISHSVHIRGTCDGFSRTGKPYVPRLDKRANITLSGAAGLSGACYLEACRSYQNNVEIMENGKYYGALTYYICRVLQKTKLTADFSWVERVRSLMKADKRLIRQNMVTETSR